MILEKLEPFGGRRGDLQAGIVAATMANTARDSKQRRRAFQPADFMPDFDNLMPKRRPWEEQLAIVEQINRAMGGKDIRNVQH
jgi:hypothetical protein